MRRRSVYFLNKCFIRVFYRFNRSRVLHLTPMQLEEKGKEIDGHPAYGLLEY